MTSFIELAEHVLPLGLSTSTRAICRPLPSTGRSTGRSTPRSRGLRIFWSPTYTRMAFVPACGYARQRSSEYGPSAYREYQAASGDLDFSVFSSAATGLTGLKLIIDRQFAEGLAIAVNHDFRRAAQLTMLAHEALDARSTGQPNFIAPRFLAVDFETPAAATGKEGAPVPAGFLTTRSP